VAEGFTVTDVPPTAPTPEFMLRVGEPVTTQASVLDCPVSTFAGVAVKLAMVGGLPTPTATVAAVAPKALTAVRK
jgi:hypothetical protein